MCLRSCLSFIQTSFADSLNNVSKKLFEFDSNNFLNFNYYFFKVLTTRVMDDGMPLMFNRDKESHFRSTSSLTLPGSSRMTRIY